MAVASPAREKTEALVESPLRYSPPRAAKPDADAASEGSSVYSGDASDRRDALGFSNRSEEYRFLFRLPTDEVLVQDFNCALQENILLQGHMYLFIHHICFYSNIFGFETKKTIPFNEVSCVRKAKTAAIFPNAIEIVAGGKKHFFGSFLSRDEAYRLIVDNWSQHGSNARNFLDRQESKLDGSSQESLENASILLEGAKESKQLEDAPSSSYRYKDADISECKSLADGNSDSDVSKKVVEVLENGKEETTEGSSPLSPATWRLEDSDVPDVPECFTLVAEAKFPVRMEDFFNLFLSDESVNFLDDYHKRCGDKEFRCTPWRQDEQFGYVRDVSFLHPIKIYLGAKFGNCQELQKCHVYRNSHIVIVTSQQISDAPYSDHFCVEGIWDVEQIEQNCCALRVYSNVAFSKKTIFKGKIEQSTKDECREVYAIWIKIAHEVLKKKNIGEKKGSINQNRVTTYSTAESGSLSKVERSPEKIYPLVNPSCISNDVPDARNGVPSTDKPVQENLGFFSYIASIVGEIWARYLSSSKASHGPLILVTAFFALLILMQISIIILLIRSPKVHLVTHGNHMSNLGNYDSPESIVWLEKRFKFLKEEMHLLETHMERVQFEYAWLKAHLENLERLKANS
uniref:VASt domain-containing protein n=1 Tax=Ananas comosus var. bracteatus TaxID=296719 RepID=A0A6V7PWQ5_ANACO|nr:unnamed protein product [Ananas comosus var. bracteatus]